MTEQPWYQRFFTDDYLRAYRHVFSPERDAVESGFVTRALHLSPGQRVLDLCCGPGRHSVVLAAQGLAVTGLDLHEGYLEQAQSAARAAGVSIETVRGDMREIPFEGVFDAVINMFSSFGYLETEADDRRVLASAARALRPGGGLLLDLLNREWVIRNQIEREWYTSEDGTVQLEERRLDLWESRNHVTFTAISPDGTRRSLGGHHIRLYSLVELRPMLAGAGLTLEAVHGGFDGSPYDVSSRRMIAIARKP